MLDFAENAVEKREKMIYNFVSEFGSKGVSLNELYNSRACSGLTSQERKSHFDNLITKEKLLSVDSNIKGEKGRPSNKKIQVFVDKYNEYKEG